MVAKRLATRARARTSFRGTISIRSRTSSADAFSQEFRLTSPAKERFRYVAGAYYGTNDFKQANAFFANYPGAPPLTGDTVTDFDQSTDSWSLFGQTDFDLTEHLTLSGGIRYTDEQKDVDLARTVLTPGILSLFVFPPYAPFSMSRSESVTDGLVNLSYKAHDGLMFYVSWAQGTKSGGFADSATLLDQSEYEAEVAQTAELGTRYQTSDGQWTVNATLYSTDVKDYQLVTFTGTQFVIDNTDLEARGLESEIIWRPTFAPGLDLSWRNTYNDAEDADTGDEIPRAPLWSGSVARRLRPRPRQWLAPDPRWIGQLRIQPDTPAGSACGAARGQHHDARRRHRRGIRQWSVDSPRGAQPHR